MNNIASINPFRYRSYYYDTETNLYYLKSRYYSPELMRFLTPDRISILDDTMDNIDACNLYVYCSNNPVMYVDPDGEDLSSIWNELGSWFNEHWAEVVIGTAFIVAGAIVSALTCGAGTAFVAAFGSALLSSAIQVGAGIVTGVVVNGLVNMSEGKTFFENAGDTIASSYMIGGILSGGSQMLSGGLRIVRKLTNFRGINVGNMRLLSPDKLYYDMPGATIFKYNKFAIDAGRYGLHMHTALTGRLHIPVIQLIIGIYEATRKRR